MSSKKLTIGGLCSGVGGIELGFKQAGFDIAWANDKNKYAMITYESIIGNNHYINGEAMPLENIISNSKISRLLTPVDVIAAGFPCQAFSVAGYQKGFDDDRGNVFFLIRDIIKILKKKRTAPKAILLENVKNFLNHDKGETYKKIKNELNNLGYSVYAKVLNSCDYSSVPQNRERTFLVCFRNEKKWNEKYNFHNNKFIDSQILTQALKDCPKTTTFHFNFPEKLTRGNLVKISDLLDEHSVVNEKYFYNEANYSKYYHMLKQQTKGIRDTGLQIRRVYIRDNKSYLCPTLTANMGGGGHNVPIVSYRKRKKIFRKLTPEECFRMQGYDTKKLSGWFNKKIVSDTQLYMQAGNSVTVPVVRRIAENIKLVLESV